MENLTQYIVPVIIVLTGILFYERSRRKNAEALNDNLETKEKILDLEKQKVPIDFKLLEEKKKELEDLLSKEVSNEELEKFFKDLLNSKPSTPKD